MHKLIIEIDGNLLTFTEESRIYKTREVKAKLEIWQGGEWLKNLVEGLQERVDDLNDIINDLENKN